LHIFGNPKQTKGKSVIEAALAGFDSSTLILAVAAFATSVISAIVGLAGGITLLAIMLFFFEPLVAIPLHGVVQLASNGSRAWIHREHLVLPITARYAALLLPLGFAGLAFARAVPQSAVSLAIGLFVLLATWAPKVLLLGTHPEESDPNRRFLVLGGVVGFLNTAIGATGPLIAPFFLNLGLTRFAVIGTMASCQVLGHAAKIVVFGATGFAFGEHVVLLALLWAMVVAGTWVGSQLLERVNEKLFRTFYMSVLTLIALRLILKEAIALFST